MCKPESSKEADARLNARLSVHSSAAILRRTITMPICFSAGLVLWSIGLNDSPARLRESVCEEECLDA